MSNNLLDSFEFIKCPVCDGKYFREVVSLTPEQFLTKWIGLVDFKIIGCNDQTRFFYQKCKNCGFVLTNPRLKNIYVDALYNNFKINSNADLGWNDVDMSWVFDVSDPSSFLFQTYYKWSTLEYFMTALSFFSDRFNQPKNIDKQRIKLLDYGSGMGHLLDLCKVFGVDGLGIDLDEKRINYCISKGLNVVRPEKLPDEKFDIIISTSVLEHIYDLESYFQLIYSHLSEGGVFVFNGLTPAIISKERRLGIFQDASPIHHVNMFTSSSLRKIGKKHGLYPISLQRVIKASLKKKFMGLLFLKYLFHRYLYLGGFSGVFLYIMTK